MWRGRSVLRPGALRSAHVLTGLCAFLLEGRRSTSPMGWLGRRVARNTRVREQQGRGGAASEVMLLGENMLVSAGVHARCYLSQ